MREMFRGHYPPTDRELDELWSGGAVILDTNILLNLYRYQVAARDDMLGVLRAVRDRIWLPHQVALEYHRRREAVIESQLEVFDKVRRILTYSRVKTQLDALQLEKLHSLISVNEVLRDIKPALDRFESELFELEEKHVKPTGPDPIRDALEELVGAAIGSAPGSRELEAIYREGETRYKNHVPPGYADEKEKRNQQEYTHGGVTYRPIYGDLVLWKQMIQYAAARKINRVIFVSDDEKADWREIREYRGKRQLLPRPELTEEIHREAGVEIFMIYSAETFLHLAKERLGVKIADATISQVVDVKAAALIDDDPRMADEHLGLLSVVAEEGNRRDAVLTCGFCHQGDTALHFYEGDGVPRLSEVLGFFHYWQCPEYPNGTPVHLLILGEKREPMLFTWTPLPHQRL